MREKKNNNSQLKQVYDKSISSQLKMPLAQNYIQLITNRIHVTAHLFSYRSSYGQSMVRTTANQVQPSTSLMFLQHLDVFCDLLMQRCTTIWNLFVLHDKEQKVGNGDVIYASVLQYIISEYQSGPIQFIILETLDSWHTRKLTFHNFIPWQCHVC